MYLNKSVEGDFGCSITPFKIIINNIFSVYLNIADIENIHINKKYAAFVR